MTTHDHVQAQMRAKLSSLALAGRALMHRLDVADDEEGMVDRGAGIDAAAYLRELVLEQRTPEGVEHTDFVLTVGGPAIWVRSFVHPEATFIYGTSAGLPEPIRWEIDADMSPDAAFAVECLLDYDVMDEGKERPSWESNPTSF